MKNPYLIKSGLLGFILLSGCASITPAIQNSETPLHKTLNTVKSELRAVRRAMADNPQDYVFSCDGASAPGEIRFSSIIVNLGVSETNSLGANAGIDPGLGVSLGADTSKSTSDGSSLSVRMRPTDVPIGGAADVVRAGGVAEALLAMMQELAKVDDRRPCLDLTPDPNKPSAVLQMSFSVETQKSASGGVDFVFLKVGGGGAKTNSYSNSITVNVDVTGRTF